MRRRQLRSDKGAPTQDQVTDAVLAASRVLVAIAARSLQAAGADVTLVQYRALVVLAYQGSQRTMHLAEELGVNSSTATRLVDRLVRRRLVARGPDPEDGRATLVEITDRGRSLIVAVTEQRRAEISRILRRVPESDRQSLVSSLEALREAAGEAPEQSWTLGWGKDHIGG